MSRIIKKFIIIAIVFSNLAHAGITINGQDINSIIKPDEVIHYTNHDSNNIVLTIKKSGDVEIGTMRGITNIEAVDNYYKKLLEQKNTLANQSARESLQLTAKAALTLRGFYGTSEKNIILEAQKEINIASAILKASAILLVTKKMNISNGCFIDAESLQIEPNNNVSSIAAIKFILNKNVGFASPSIECDIDFENKEIDQRIIVCGTQELWLQFKPEAFSQNS